LERRHGGRRRVIAVVRREWLQGWRLAMWGGGRASRHCERRLRRSVWGTSRACRGRRTPWGSSRGDAGLGGDGGEERWGGRLSRPGVGGDGGGEMVVAA